MKTHEPAKIAAPSSVPAALAAAVVAFIVSLPLVWLIGNFAAFVAYGLGIWIIPWLGARVSLYFLASKGTGGYQITVIVFAVIAALQNAALIFWNQRNTSASRLQNIVLKVLIGLSVFALLAGMVVMFAL